MAAHVYAFLDAAVVSNRGGLECKAGTTRCEIGSTGIGVRGTWKNWSLNLDIGHALRGAVETRRGDSRAHFVFSTHFGY